MSPGAETARDFFGRLANLPSAIPAQYAFLRLFPPAAAGALPRHPDLVGDLQRALIAHLLEWLGLPRSAGGLNWEWRPLVRLVAEADPFYFTEQQVARHLAECPPTTPQQKAILVRALKGWLDLRRTGALSRTPALVPEALQHPWVALFPPEYAWRSLDLLRGAGLYPIGSAAGWRAFRRFSAGEFDPPTGGDALRTWQDACWSVAAPEGDASAAHRADFLAAAHGGELRAAGLTGPCGDVPRCDQCALRPECSWANKQGATAVPAAAAASARARLGQLEGVSLDRLLDGLFGLAPEERNRLAQRLTGTSLRTLAAKSATELEEWLAQDGGTPARPGAERWLLLFEICRRFGEERLTPGVSLTGAEDVFRHFRMRLRDLKQERFLVVLLDVKKRYLGDAMITQGGLDSSPAHPREVFAAAVRERAAAVLLVHNHPSGDPTPSQTDVEMTRELAKLGTLMGIPVIDHVVFGDEGFVSMRESGLVDL